jgi:hypothetical protein
LKQIRELSQVFFGVFPALPNTKDRALDERIETLQHGRAPFVTTTIYEKVK